MRARIRFRLIDSWIFRAREIGLGRDRAGGVQLAGVIANLAARAPLVEPFHEPGVGRPVGGIGPDARGRAAHAFKRRSGVEQGHQARPCPREIRGQQQRILLADHAVDRVRGVGPVDEHADHGIVDRAELGDGLVGPRQVIVHEIGRSAQLLERGDELPGGLTRLRKGPLVGLGPIVSRPENRDFLRHGTPEWERRVRCGQGLIQSVYCPFTARYRQEGGVVRRQDDVASSSAGS